MNNVSEKGIISEFISILFPDEGSQPLLLIWGMQYPLPT